MGTASGTGNGMNFPPRSPCREGGVAVQGDGDRARAEPPTVGGPPAGAGADPPC